MGDFYSTLEDLKVKHNELVWLVNQCHNVVLIDVDQRNLLINVPLESQPLYAYLLTVLKRLKKNNNFQFENLYQEAPWSFAVPQRPCPDPVLWVGGCSISAGCSINTTDSYAHQLSILFNMPLAMLAEGGSSIQRQFDRWVAADIKSGDILIWGLTNFSRLDVMVKDQWTKVTTSNYFTELSEKYRYWNVDFFNSPTQAMSSIRQILQFEKLCKKLSINDYCLVNILDDTWSPWILDGHNKFLDIGANSNPDNRYNFVDYGEDQMHPGPNQHRLYATKIANFIRKKNETLSSQ